MAYNNVSCDGYGKAPRTKRTKRTASKSQPVGWPAPSRTGFVTTTGRASHYQKLVVNASRTTNNDLSVVHTCVLKGRARRHGTKRQWAKIVQSYLDAETSGEKVRDDLESFIVAQQVPSTDPRVALRGQKGVFVRPGMFISKYSNLKCKC